MKTAPADSYPHEISCPSCRDENRCNYCGKGNCRASDGRCTNGRCVTCCAKHCQHDSPTIQKAGPRPEKGNTA